MVPLFFQTRLRLAVVRTNELFFFNFTKKNFQLVIVKNENILVTEKIKIIYQLAQIGRSFQN